MKKTKYCLTGTVSGEQLKQLSDMGYAHYSCKLTVEADEENPVKLKEISVIKAVQMGNVEMVICGRVLDDYMSTASRLRNFGLKYVHSSVLTGSLPVFIDFALFDEEKLEWNDNHGNSVKFYQKPKRPNGVISINGENNELSFGVGLTPFRRIMIKMNGNKNTVKFGKDIRTGNSEAYYFDEPGLRIVCQDGGTVKIFNRTSIGGAMLSASNGGNIIIGADCMFGWDINVWQNPGHMIVDYDTGKMTNKCEDIVIGRHCWLGKGVTLMSGASLADGCAMGYGAITSSKFEEPNCIIAGFPAKVVRRNALWSRDFVSADVKTLEKCRDKIGLDIMKMAINAEKKDN